MNVIHRFSVLKVASVLRWMPFFLLFLLLYSLTFSTVSEKVIASLLESQGIQGITFSVRELSLNNLVFENVAVTDEATVKEIDISYSINTLLKGRPSRIDIRGLQTNLTIQKGELISPFLHSIYQDDATAWTQVLPSDVSIEGVEINVTGYAVFQDENFDITLQKGGVSVKNLFSHNESGHFRKPFTFHFNEKAKNLITLIRNAATGMQLKYSLALKDVTAFLDLPAEEKEPLQTDLYLYQVALSGKVDFPIDSDKQMMTLNYDIQEGWLKSPNYEVEGNRIFLAGTLNELLEGNGKFKGEFGHISEPPLFNILSLKGDFKHTAESIVLDGMVHDLFEKLNLSMKTNYNLDAKQGTVSFGIDPLVFSQREYALTDLSPFAGQFVRGFTGKLGLQGNIAIHEKELKPNITVSLKNASFSVGETVVSGVTTQLSINNLSPLTTKKRQKITIAKVGLPAPMKNVKADFSVGKKNINVSNLRWDWMKGKVVVEPYNVNRKTFYPDAIKVVLKGIDLSEVLTLVNRPGLTGKGTLDGVLPVSFKPDGEFSIEGGVLEDNGTKGILRYMPDDATYSLAQGNENMSLLFRALEDFHYTKLKMTIDGSSRDEVTASLHVQGANPSLYKGRSVELNISLGGALLELIKSAIGFYTLPETLKKRYDNMKTQ